MMKTMPVTTTVVVVSHVTPIKTLLRLALDAGQGILYRLHLDLASLSIAEFYPDGVASVRIYADTSVFANRPSDVSSKTPIAVSPRMRRRRVLVGMPVALDNASAVCGPVAK